MGSVMKRLLVLTAMVLGACGPLDPEERDIDVLDGERQVAAAPDPEDPEPPASHAPTPNPDVQPPRVQITSPQEGAKVQKNVTLQATITDDVGVSRADVFLDNKLLTSKGAAPWSFAVVLPVGKHTLRVEGRDAMNKMGSAAVTVFVDGPQPAAPAPDPSSPAPTAPATGKTYGEPCTTATECASRICANDLTLGRQYCTQTCDPETCPVGSDCFTSTNGQSVCAPLLPGETGNPRLQPRATDGNVSCAVAQTHGAPDPFLLLVLLAGLLFRRQ